MEYTKLDENSQQAEQPIKIKIKMKHHQLASLYYINKLENNDYFRVNNKKVESTMGVIADKVGSGKSLIVLSVIANKKILNKTLHSYKSDGYINTIRKNEDKECINTNVIVVPHGLVKQWQKYIEQHTTLKYITVNNKKTFLPIKEDINKLNEYDITLVSSTKYNEFTELFNIYYPNTHLYETLKVSRLFIDETDSIKISSCKKLHASFYWFITSSYKRLLSPDGEVKYENVNGQLSNYYNYSLGYFKRVVINGITSRGFIREALCKFSIITENISSKLIIKNCDKFIESSFKIEQPNIIKILCKNPISLNILSGVISNDILSHVNAGDVHGAIEKLNCTKVNENNLIKTVTIELENTISNKKIELEMKSKMIYSSEQAKNKSLQNINNKIIELESKKKSIIDRLNDNKMCPICYDDINNCSIPKCCKSSFCFECLSLWLSQNSNCPLCRTFINVNDLIVITQEKQKSKDELLDKIVHVKDIIENKINKDSKVLIFSGYDNTFNQITNILVQNNIKYARLMGQSTAISNKVNSFKSTDEDSIKALMLNSNYFGSGLNLENATDLIIYHNMNEELTQQVIGRAQRPGRTKKLNIYVLCYENEIDNCVI